jgi:hypothetical protein
MQIYAFLVENPNKIGYFFDLAQKKYKEQSTKYKEYSAARRRRHRL